MEKELQLNKNTPATKQNLNEQIYKQWISILYLQFS